MKRFKTYMKGFFKGWNAFECAFIVIAIIMPVTLGLVFNSSALEIISGSVNGVVTMLIAKGKIEGYFLGIFPLYALVSWSAGLYGEFINSVISTGVLFVGIYSWITNRRSDVKKGQVVRVNQLGRAELSIVAALSVPITVGLYFMLRAFGTNYLIISVAASFMSLLGTYFLARRSFLCMPAYIIADIGAIILWLLIIINGSTGAVATLTLSLLWLVSDTYGAFQWRRLYKRQQIAREQLQTGYRASGVES
jgi:nicotinamide mononucleotide transporter